MTNIIEEHEEINLHISKRLLWNALILIGGTLWYWFGIYYWQEQIKDSVNYAFIPFFTVMFMIILIRYFVNHTNE